MEVAERGLEAPLPLLLSDSSGHFYVVPETARIVAAIDKPVVVVAVVGKIRTGKSFLMNRLAGSNSGFMLGSTIKSHTKGIWVWPRPHPLDKKKHLLLLDTEGLGEVNPEGDTDNDHDTWLFVMSVLLSSMLVYNTTGILSTDGLEHLRFVLNLTDHLRTDTRQNAHEPGSDFGSYFPSLVLCLRDFTMKLEVNGEACTSDDYMEHFLKMRVDPQEDGHEVNAQRQLLCQYFKERKCFMFPKPTDLRSLLNLQKLPDDKLDELFMETANSFTGYTIGTARLKQIKGAVFSGLALVRLVEEYVAAERRRAVPCIESALRAVLTTTNREAKQAAMTLYAARMAQANLELPLPLQLINGYHQQAVEPAVWLYHELTMLDRDHLQEKELLVELTREYAKLITRNSEVSWQRCERRLLQLYQPIREKVDRQELHKPGGYRKFRALIDKVHDDYYEAQTREEEQENVYKLFMDRRDMDGKVILRADRNVTDAEKNEIVSDERSKRQERDQRATAERDIQNEIKMQAIKNETQVAEEAFVTKSHDVEQLIAQDLEEERQQHSRMLRKFIHELEPLLEEALNMFLLLLLSP
ncbi:guanylate-binding protein 1-like [Lethenteron reissneri]|uniref:guanylate-binding protein 1-like n=1 Tax=Lethenteron reissneri TaxID=7753 RepID=UPI002AB6DEAD|nr:guanylate-binding protein 1-like [Lethenteron reissneri]